MNEYMCYHVNSSYFWVKSVALKHMLSNRANFSSIIIPSPHQWNMYITLFENTTLWPGSMNKEKITQPLNKTKQLCFSKRELNITLHIESCGSSRNTRNCMTWQPWYVMLHWNLQTGEIKWNVIEGTFAQFRYMNI